MMIFTLRAFSASTALSLPVKKSFAVLKEAPRHEHCGPGSSVGIATDYGLDGPGSIPVGTRFTARPDQLWGPPTLI